MKTSYRIAPNHDGKCFRIYFVYFNNDWNKIEFIPQWRDSTCEI